MPGMKASGCRTDFRFKKIIFTTAYKEYAAEAFDLNVVDYVRKPIKKERLIQAFEKAKEQIKMLLKKILSNGIPTSVKPLFLRNRLPTSKLQKSTAGIKISF
jgi:DNA-binding LytR/AlgR family response regulator